MSFVGLSRLPFAGLVVLRTNGLLQTKLPKHAWPMTMFLCAQQQHRLLSRHAVKGVIFDMGGVILPSPFPIVAKIEQEFGLPAGAISEDYKNPNGTNVCSTNVDNHNK